MADPRFFLRKGPYTAREISERLGIQLKKDQKGEKQFQDIGSLGDADPGMVSFLFNRKYLDALKNTKAGAVFVEEAYADRVPEGCIALVTHRPYYDFARLSQLFYPEEAPQARTHPASHIDETASIGENVRIDAGAVIGEGCVISQKAWIGANAVIDHGVTIGEGTWIGPNAYIGYADLGDHCRIHAGARIGCRGFGFAMDPDGFIDIPQLGTVKIGHFVEVGANTCIDRGMGPDTVIGDGTKLDNLVQIGHNVNLGKGCVIAGQGGIAGSTVLEDFVVCGAQSGVSGHLQIGAGSHIAARGGVIQNIDPGARVGGFPAVPLRQWFRQHLVLNNLAANKRK